MTPTTQPEGLSAAIERLERYVKIRDEKPIRNQDDEIHGVHVGTEWEGTLQLSDLRLVLAALNAARPSTEQTEGGACPDCGSLVTPFTTTDGNGNAIGKREGCTECMWLKPAPPSPGEGVEALRELAADLMAWDKAEADKGSRSYKTPRAAYREAAARIIAALHSPQGAGNSEVASDAARLREDPMPPTWRGPDPWELQTALHELVMLKAQDDIGCVPPPTKEQWAAAWSGAEELTRNEP